MRAWASPTVPSLAEAGFGLGLPLSIHDTASDERVLLEPAGRAGIYVCGITPYDATHLGHAATYLAFDEVQRVWRDAGLDVTSVQNVTDIDDPLLERAARDGIGWRELGEREIELFRGDMQALRVLPPDHFTGVVESMDRVIGLVERLRAVGATYELDGDLYFPVAADPAFGSVSRLERQAMPAVFAERGGDPDRAGKRDPLDWLLWRAKRPGEPAWESPFGPGRPGWHVECAAMAVEHLGMGFEMQGGGSDLAFPHHEMSAAEARTACDEKSFAQTFVHAGMVGLDGEKMSKSLGNLVLVSRLREQGVDPLAVRLALLAHHYRADWFWTPDDLSAAEQRLSRWRAAAAVEADSEVTDSDHQAAVELVGQLRAALADDLDTPTAVGVVDAWADRRLASDVDGATASGAAVTLAVDALLGISL
jgi:L-cysteine:1D-myo-inositol 2-amino-2-deoxy-alpha-D-glucopyranoside ligase